MVKLAEIEAAAEALSPEQKQELLLYLAVSLRKQGAQLPTPRQFDSVTIDNWLKEDSLDMQRLREKQ